MGIGLGRFVTATVWPPEVADKISRRLERVHITGPLRTLGQDIAFGIDQLVQRSFEKVRQAADGMPAVLIRQLGAPQAARQRRPGPWRPGSLARFGNRCA